MFCIDCGTQLVDTARFCSSCGKSVSSSIPTAASTPISPPMSPPVYRPVTSPVSPSSALLNANGYPSAAFERLATALFNTLDQTVPPRRTGGMEVSKMIAYRTLGGATVPPFYGEHVLPTYASVVGIDLIPGQPRDAPVVSWNGWHQILLQKITAEPEATFMHLSRVLVALNVPITLTRADFPVTSWPSAEAKEGRFRFMIYGMARRGLASGVIGGAGLGGGMGMYSGVSQMSGGGGGGGDTSSAVA